MPNILRKGKHKKLSSLNRRRGGRKDYCYPRKHGKVYFSIFQYRFVFMGCLWKYLSHSGCFTFIGKFSCHCISNDFSVNPNRNIFSKKDKRNILTSLGIFSLLRNKLSTPTDWSQHVLELQIVQQLRVNLQFFQWSLSWQNKHGFFFTTFVLILEQFWVFYLSGCCLNKKEIPLPQSDRRLALNCLKFTFFSLTGWFMTILFSFLSRNVNYIQQEDSWRD